MKIKDFFKGLTLGAVLSTPAFADRLAYPIESRADPGTVLDPQKAAKVRKLVGYAITRPHQRGVVEYVRDYFDLLYLLNREASKNVQDVQVAMVIGNTKYTLLIQNRPEGQDDVLFIYQRPRGRYNPKKVISVADGGLDGRVDLPTDRQDLYDQTIDRLLAFYEGRSKQTSSQ